MVVDAYVDTGEPVGSRTNAKRLGTTLSAATIRHVRAALQVLGLRYSPHTSAGLLPTEAGLRLFVDGLLEIGSLTENGRTDIEARCASIGRSFSQALEQAGTLLAGLSRHAGLVVAPKAGTQMSHIEFVNIGGGRALVVLVDRGGNVENRVIELPPGLPAAALIQATNYPQARLIGRTLNEARADIAREMEEHRAALDALTCTVVERGLAVWGGDGAHGTLIVRGQARLLDDVTAIEDLERIRSLFDALETKESLLRLVDAAEQGEGVQIFIGAENELFGHAGWSMILAPYSDEQIGRAHV